MPDISKIKAQEQGNAISKQLADMNQERKVLIKGSMEKHSANLVCPERQNM